MYTTAESRTFSGMLPCKWTCGILLSSRK